MSQIATCICAIKLARPGRWVENRTHIRRMVQMPFQRVQNGYSGRAHRQFKSHHFRYQVHHLALLLLHSSLPLCAAIVIYFS